MFRAYLVVTALAAAANLYAAANDFRRVGWILDAMDRLKVQRSRLPLLGILKTVGATGLLVGIAVPWIGVAAGSGLTLFFVCAILQVLRCRWFAHLPYPAVWLLLASCSLALRVGTAYAR